MNSRHTAPAPSSSLRSCLRRLRRAALLLLLLSHATATAQTVEHTENKPDQALRSGSRVDPSTLAMGLGVPLGDLPGRGGTGLPVGLRYSSKVWRIEYISSHSTHLSHHTWLSPRFAEYSAAGWTTSLAVPRIEYTGMSNYYRSTGEPKGEDLEGGNDFEPRFYIARINVHLPDGSSHELRRDDEPHILPDGQGADFSGVFRAVDGSRLRYDHDAKTLYLPDGSRYLLGDPEGMLEHFNQPSPPTLFIDRNGNTLTYNHQARQWTDTLGRALNVPLPRTPVRGDATYSLPRAGGGTVDYVLKWRDLSEVLTNPGQALRYRGQHQCGPTYTQVPGQYLFASSFPDFICAAQIFNPVVLAEIVLPTGQKYGFTYNLYGEIDKVSFPSGGYERFTYEEVPGLGFVNAPYRQANRGVTRRWVSASGEGGDEAPWEYGVTTGAFQSPPYTAFTVAPDLTRSERVLQTGGGGGHSPPFGFEDARVGVVLEERSYSAPDQNNQRQMLRRKLSEWAVTSGSNGATRDPRVTKEVLLVLDTGGDALSQMTTYLYDADQNVTSTASRAYAAVSQTTAQTSAVGVMPQGALLRTDETTYVVNDPSLPQATRDAYRARNMIGLPSSTLVRNAAGAVVAQSAMRYDEAAYAPLPCGAAVGWSDPLGNVRGLATTALSWVDTTNTWVETHAQYDQCGNPRKSWDARGNVSEAEYSADYHFAYPTLTRSPVPDPTGQYGSPTALETETTYDFATGRVTSTKDANDQVINFIYTDDQGVPDPMGRLRKVVSPGGGWTKYLYAHNAFGEYVNTQTLQNSAGVVRSSYQFFDGLGRPSRSFVYENQDPARPWLTTDTEYDAMARVKRVSLQYRSTGAESPPFSTDKWVETAYDALGRIRSTRTMPDAATTTTVYSGNHVTVTDPAGKQRRNVTDALGRLVRVVEDPAGLAYATDYTYDVLGKLRKVDQGGQLRFFAYDSLGRLLRAKHPEQGNLTADANFPALADSVTGHAAWSLAYTYDAAGNVTKRKDARNIVATYDYDNLNRGKTVDYSDATPDVVRTYDGATLGKGRSWRSEAAQTARTTIEQYDAEGRSVRQSQQFWAGSGWGTAYTVQHAYNLSGELTSQTYPSGHTTTHTYDAAGRPAGFSGNLGEGTPRTYSSGIIYDELGGMKREQYGTQTPLYKRLFYNSRGQLSDIRLGTYHATDDGWWNRGAILNVYSAQAGWTESGPDNNGNLRKQMVFVPNDDGLSGWTQMTQFYSYDALNRLATVEEKRGETDFFQTYGYDRWGNRTINAAATWDTSPGWDVPEPQFEQDAANPAYREVAAPSNRLYAPGDGGRLPGQKWMGYDAAGHLVHDSYTGGGARAYDAEGRMTAAHFLSGQTQTATYAYDADGRRVKRQAGVGAPVWQVYGLGGELLAEYAANAAPASPQKEYGYRGGELLVVAEPAASVALTNVSDGKPASQSSTGWGGLASRAVDGNTSGAWDSNSVSHTDYETQPWWQVDLQGVQQIGRVDFWLMTDCCAARGDFDVKVSDDGVSWSSYYVAGPLDSGSVTANRTGRYVRVQLRGAGYVALAEVRVFASAPQRANHALAANGAAAAASSTHSTGYSAAGAINGDRKGLNWGAGGGWNDATLNSFPDWLEVTFPGAKTVDEVNVFTVQDAYPSPSEPTEQMTFGSYGVTSFEVQAWDGAQWATVPGGNVSGNNKVWRKFTFPAVTTTKVRVLVNGGMDGYSRLTEVEAWGPTGAGGGGGGGGVRWLVADHLGTPRMVLDETGSLNGVGRHDYLPFGEELGAGAGGRTAAQGYGEVDHVRQKFTKYERDDETGLDFAQARYYASTQGRFTSLDPLLASAKASNPQSWNRYTYVYNSPLRLIDPSGMMADASQWGWEDEDGGKSAAELAYEERLQHTYNALDATRAARNGDWDTYIDLMTSDPTLVNASGSQSGSAKLYYWFPTNDSMGHLALELSDGTYISFYPGRKDMWSWVPGTRREAGADPISTLAELEYDGKWQTKEHDFADSAKKYATYELKGLNETAIKTWFESMRAETPKWHIGNNCADVVAQAVQVGGLNVKNTIYGFSTPRTVKNIIMQTYQKAGITACPIAPSWRSNNVPNMPHM